MGGEQENCEQAAGESAGADAVGLDCGCSDWDPSVAAGAGGRDGLRNPSHPFEGSAKEQYLYGCPLAIEVPWEA